jgi:hypothetical protein
MLDNCVACIDDPFLSFYLLYEHVEIEKKIAMHWCING